MNHPHRLRLSKLSLGLIAALAAAPVFAQSTSAGVGGTVVGADGQPVAGAEVTITHVESGTVSRAFTDASGRYSARGLRVGGPYTITVAKDGAGTDTESNVYLDLNQVNSVNAQLTGNMTLATVTVAGTAPSSVFSATKMGSGTSVDQETIRALPSINGNIQDYMRLDPRVAFTDRASGNISAGGQNPRFNAISIDGVSASDTFGLEGNNMPTKRQPVSIEAIEALDINLSNYDVTIAGAAGANINAVTKSGTNELHGSLYGYMRDSSWFGDYPTTGQPFDEFEDEHTWGATVGGPILKDRLFFFANYEKYKQASPGVDLAGSPLANPNADFDADDVSEIQRIARERYGFEAGDLESGSDTELEEYALKLDWNINDNHRANLRYSNLDQSKVRPEGTSSSTLALSSSWYVHAKSVESYVAQVFSDWSDVFSTEMKVSFRDYSAIRQTSTTAPSIRVFFDGDALEPSGDSIQLGTEANSMGNAAATETWNYYLGANWAFGDHELKFGFEYSDNDVFNYYGRDAWGNYTFFGLENFDQGIWSTYSYQRERTPGSIAVNYSNRNLGLFVQDTWYVNSNLTLNFGLRADRPTVSPNPPHNAQAQADWGFDTSEVLDGDYIVQPRFGFNYTFDTERRTQMRGGIGLFQGDAPQVWIANGFGNNGLNSVSYFYDEYDPSLPFSANGLDQPVPPGDPNAGIPCTSSSARCTMNFVDKDFELPSIWKANLAIDHELPWYGMVGTAEVLLTDTKTGLYYDSLNLGPGFIGPDGRELHWNPDQARFSSAGYGRNPNYDYVYLLKNTNKGKSQQLTVMLEKPWSLESDWWWNLGYTYTNATEVGSLTSSTASSGYSYQHSFNVGEEISKNGRYEIKDRLSGALNWKHAFFGDYETRVGLVYEGRSGRPYSYIFNGDANGDRRSNNDLFYVPAGQGDVLFGSISSSGEFTADPEMEASFYEWLGGQTELSAFAGTYAPANAFRADWVNTFDLRITQELPGLFKEHKSQIWLDIQNVGNLINKDWGHILDYGFFGSARVARLEGIHDGKYVYNYRFADDPSIPTDSDSFTHGISQWSAQIGFKYEF